MKKGLCIFGLLLILVSVGNLSFADESMCEGRNWEGGKSRDCQNCVPLCISCLVEYNEVFELAIFYPEAIDCIENILLGLITTTAKAKTPTTNYLRNINIMWHFR